MPTKYDTKMTNQTVEPNSTSTMLNKKSAMEKSSMTEEKVEVKDNTAWGWVVVLGSHLCHQLIWGMFRSTGVLLVEWKHDFNTSAAMISSVVSVLSAALLITGPVAGFLCKRYGCRVVTMLGGFLSALGILLGSQAQRILHLYISIGGLCGMGFSLAYTASAVVPGHYFDKRFALANGISCAGTGVGVMIIPPLVQMMIDKYGWRGSMIIMSMVVANVCSFGALFRPIKSTKKVQKLNAQKSSQTNGTTKTLVNSNKEYIHLNTSADSPVEIREDHTCEQKHNLCKKIMLGFCKVAGLHLFVKSRRLIFLSVTQMMVGISYAGVMVHIVSHIGIVCIERTSVEISLILSVTGIGSLVARVGHGFLVDRNFLTPLTGYNIGIIGAAITVLVIPGIKNYLWFAVFGVIFGLCVGLNMSLLRVLVKDFVGVKNLAQGIGLSQVVFFGAGDLIGPVLSGWLYDTTGWLYDTTGSYSVAFFILGGLLLVTGPMMLLVPLLQKLDLKYKPLKAGEDVQENTELQV